MTTFKKLASFTDIHFGRQNSNETANLDNLDFIHWFIDRAKSLNCDAVAFLGDYFDNRHTIHVSTLNYGLRGLEMLNEAFDTVYIIIGNHDLLYRDKRDMTSMAFAKHLTNIRFISDPLTIGEGKNGITFLPWLVKDEYKSIKRLKSRYIFGHLELNGGFLMNAKTPMPDRPDALGSKDFPNQDLLLSGHFHYRQAIDNAVYIGNSFPFNFADNFDEDRGMMILEWGRDPVFEHWPDQPLYRTMLLSDLLNQPDKMLCSKLTARVSLDLDISFEEAQVIRDEYMRQYGVRKIELIHQSVKSSMDHQFIGDVSLQSIDQIVIDGLMNIKSDNNAYNSSKLIEIYRSLGGTLI